MLMMCGLGLCFQSNSGLPSPGWVWDSFWWFCVGTGSRFEMWGRSSLGPGSIFLGLFRFWTPKDHLYLFQNVNSISFNI